MTDREKKEFWNSLARLSGDCLALKDDCLALKEVTAKLAETALSPSAHSRSER